MRIIFKSQHQSQKNINHTSRRPQSGFTIVELATVIVVIAILVSVIAVGYRTWRHEIAVSSVKSDLSQISSAMKSTKNFKNGFPEIAPNTKFNGDAATKGIFVSSPDVVMTYIDGGKKAYCIEAESASFEGVVYHLSADNGNTISEGVCPAVPPSSPTSPTTPSTPSTPPTTPSPSGPVSVSDDFNRTGSTLGTTPVGGLTWQDLTGQWETDGSKAGQSVRSGSNSPLSVIDAGISDLDASLNIGEHDALYFRVKDANNWWRVSQDKRTETTSESKIENYTYYTYNYSLTPWSQVDSLCENGDNYPASGTWYRNYEYGYATKKIVHYGRGSGGCAHVFDNKPGDDCWKTGPGCGFREKTFKRNVSRTSTAHTGQHVVMYQVDTDYYDLILEKMVNGTVSEVWRQSGPKTEQSFARVVANGNTIKVYDNSGELTTVTDSFNASETKHGIGRTWTEINDSNIDNFSLKSL